MIIIHYSEYSSERILFHADFNYTCVERYVIQTKNPNLELNQMHNEDTLNITVSSIRQAGFIHSYKLKLRKIHCINMF